MVLWGYEIWRFDIPSYFTPRALRAFDLWKTYRVFGFPFAGGWADQPAVYWDDIETLEIEERRREVETRRLHGGK